MHRPLTRTDKWLIRIAAYGVGVNGLLYVWAILLVAVRLRPSSSLHYVDVLLPILTGLTLLYLSTLLARHKRAAWNVTVPVYFFSLGYTVNRLLSNTHHPYALAGLLHTVVLPVVILALLMYYRDAFTVRSDVANFAGSLRFIVVILFIALLYGTGGFLLLDTRDFHEEITFTGAIHHTVDQFNITTGDTLTPHTKRAKIFLESLSIVSSGALFYAVVSLFQPLRSRYTDQSRVRQRAAAMLAAGPASSEDIFKLWPHDKTYFLAPDDSAGFAYKVERGVALIVGDPIGNVVAANQLWPEFAELCRTNDWLPAFVHTEPAWNNFYKQHGFKLQKIGEEAIVDLAHFDAAVRRNKYFRHINNKFSKQSYSVEILHPPHSLALLKQIKSISDEWLQQPGRAERGFMMGFANDEYFQQNALGVVRDEAGQVCAFINQVTSYNPAEINFDLLRHRKNSPGNINDYLLLHFMQYASDTGFQRINLGLTPLSGIDADNHEPDSKLINSTLQFLYSNGDRFYSFSGLRRFKSKYEPSWENRYVAFRGGVRGFTRTVNALNRAWQVKQR